MQIVKIFDSAKFSIDFNFKGKYSTVNQLNSYRKIAVSDSFQFSSIVRAFRDLICCNIVQILNLL